MTAIEILDKYRLHKTRVRIKVLDALLNNECLSCAEIINKIKITQSRASVLRVLNFFRQKGFVHTMIDKNPKQRFFFSEEKLLCHIYFICNKCKKLFIFRLAGKIIKHLPQGLSIEKIACNVKGICIDCSDQH